MRHLPHERGQVGAVLVQEVPLLGSHVKEEADVARLGGQDRLKGLVDLEEEQIGGQYGAKMFQALFTFSSKTSTVTFKDSRSSGHLRMKIIT